MNKQVILVNEHDQELGIADKELVHKTGQLHRAFSIFLFSEDGRMMLHQRASHKYHSPELWTNACCSHPEPGVPIERSLHTRLKEEMGIQCSLQFAFTHCYHLNVGGGMIEHEFDHIYTGQCPSRANPNPNEVQDYGLFHTEEIDYLLLAHPERFTAWFKLLYPLVKAHCQPQLQAIHESSY
jgi:isopentenyl-diphosphate delta-isomerase